MRHSPATDTRPAATAHGSSPQPDAAVDPFTGPTLQTLRADRGQARDNRGLGDAASVLAAISRSSGLEVADPQASFWLVLRGSAQLDCNEGRFRLQPGEWIALDRDSRPTLQAARNALVLALLLPGPLAESSADMVLYPGRGLATRRERRMALRYWRGAGTFGATDVQPTSASAALQRILHTVASLQDTLQPLLGRCPGRSLRRRRQVLARMQRARLYLDGHLARNVRLSELARLTIFSTWYFTKTFHALYDEGPRDLTSRLRLRQASTLLLQTDLSIAEVGEACGFENPCSFARAFRANYGMTASSFRGTHRRA
jgi:AraC family transcriptional regulator